MPDTPYIEDAEGPGDVYFDLAALSYQKFLDFFFDRAVEEDGGEVFRLFCKGFDYCETPDPSTVVEYMRRAFQQWPSLARKFSYQQLAQGTIALFGLNICCYRYLFDSSVSIALRIECVEAMFVPFASLLKFKEKPAANSIASFLDCADEYFMWWDQILWGFWFEVDYHQLTLSTDPQRILDTVHHTLVRILEIDDLYCQLCALHGFNHSRHPLAAKVVQRYLDSHRVNLTPSDITWLELCRDGKYV